MLVLSRKTDQSVVIQQGGGLGRIVRVTLLESTRGGAKLGFEAEENVVVHREEVWERIRNKGALSCWGGGTLLSREGLDRWEDDGGGPSTAQVGSRGQFPDSPTAKADQTLEEEHRTLGLGARNTPMTTTNSGRRQHDWFALADAEHCRLLCCSLTEQGTQHVDEHEGLENTLPEQEHARPATLSGTTHHVEEKERRFAGEIVKWLQKKAGEHKIDRLMIFAPGRMLGALRKVAVGSLKGHLEELQGDLMRLKPGQLAEHPMIRDLMLATSKR